MAYDANGISSTTTAQDQEKYLAAKLLERSYLRLVAASICDKDNLPQGNGLTGYMIRYNRMNVPTSPLTEGVDPSYSNFTTGQVTVTMDQWGDVMVVTDVAKLTTKHPLMSQIMELLTENAQRVVDREVQLVWLAGTNVQYGDSTVTTRRAITSGMKLSDTIISRANVTLQDAGAPERGGPSGVDVSSGQKTGNFGGQNYVAVGGPQVIQDIMQTGTSFGSWVSVATYNVKMDLYNSEVGTWLNVRWVKTNFVPKFTMLGNNTEAVTSGAAFGTGTPTVTATATGGSLTTSAVYGFKVTRKELTRGFEETISLAHTITMSATSGNTYSVAFSFAAVTGNYVYNIYFDSVQAGSGATPADSVLKLVASNIAAGASYTVTAIGSTGAAAPDNPATGLTIHPIYFHGNASCAWMGFQKLEFITSIDQATLGNPLKLRQTVGYKFMAKAVIKDQTRVLRAEVVSTY